MESIYILLLIFLIYVFFGKFVDVVLGNSDSTKMLRINTKLFFKTFVAPITLGLVILFLNSFGDKTISIILGLGLIVTRFIITYWSKEKYLTGFDIGSTIVNFHYLTPFLKQKHITLDVQDVSDFEFAKANTLVNYPATVNFKYKGAWTKFEVIDKRLKEQILEKIEATNMGIEDSGANNRTNQQR